MSLLFLAEGGNPLLDPHGFGLVFWTGIVFGVVCLVLYKGAWGPLLQALQDREDAITGTIRAADETRAEAERLRLEYEAQLEKVRQEAQAIIDEGRADGKQIVAAAHTKAAADASEIKARAERDIVLAKQKALSEVKIQATGLGLAIAEKLLAAEIDAQKHQVLVDDVLASYERG